MSGISGGVSPEELEDLMRQSKQSQEPQQLAPPCVIVMKSGKRFIISEPECWVWHPRGIFGTGFWENDLGGKELDLLLVDIEYVEYDFSGFADEVPPIAADPEAHLREELGQQVVDDDEGPAVA